MIANHAPFSPAFDALAKALTGGMEVAAVLVSFVFSLVLVAAIRMTARDCFSNAAALLAMFTFAVNGAMISLSITVLTKISFLAVVYLFCIIRAEKPNALSRPASGKLEFVAPVIRLP